MNDRFQAIRNALAMEPTPNPADMHWIAACDPDTIRELLRQRDELLALVRDYIVEVEHYQQKISRQP